MNVRRAEAGDFLAIAALDRVAWRDNRNTAYVPDGEHVWRHWAEDALVFCAVDGDRVVGAAVAFPCLDGRFCAHKAFVAPGHRGQGIGPALLEALTAELDRRGVAAFLTVDPVNAHAVALYERFGFTVDRCVAGYYRPEEDRLVMVRPPA